MDVYREVWIQFLRNYVFRPGFGSRSQKGVYVWGGGENMEDLLISNNECVKQS